MPVADHVEIVLTEAQQVVLHRYADARRYGLTRLEARLYAESEINVSELRRLRRVKCPPIVGAKILL
jgi:hypothetical protein